MKEISQQPNESGPDLSAVTVDKASPPLGVLDKEGDAARSLGILGHIALGGGAAFAVIWGAPLVVPAVLVAASLASLGVGAMVGKAEDMKAEKAAVERGNAPDKPAATVTKSAPRV